MCPPARADQDYECASAPTADNGRRPFRGLARSGEPASARSERIGAGLRRSSSAARSSELGFLLLPRPLERAQQRPTRSTRAGWRREQDLRLPSVSSITRLLPSTHLHRFGRALCTSPRARPARRRKQTLLSGRRPVERFPSDTGGRRDRRAPSEPSIRAPGRAPRGLMMRAPFSARRPRFDASYGDGVLLSDIRDNDTGTNPRRPPHTRPVPL